MLVSVPWVNPDPGKNGNGRFSIRSKPSDEEKRTVEV
jgi:hypothetical protein